jgi:ABC-2 type transport system ATP-binding protein
MGNILELKNISYSYKDKEILQGINLSLDCGQILGISGKNGSGKSTLLKIISGFLEDYKGEMYLDPKAVSGQMGCLIDGISIYEDLKVKDNLKMISKISNNEPDTKLIAETGLDSYMEVRGSKLSLGNKQKLALIMTLGTATGLALLDEPFNGLDIKTKAYFMNYIKKRRNSGMTIIITSHIKGDLEMLCDRIYQMK